MRRIVFIIRKFWHFFAASKLPVYGKDCEISPTATFMGVTKSISLGNHVSVLDGARFHCNKESEIVIGDDCVISWGATINTTKRGGYIRIGKNSSVNQHTILSGSGGIVIGDNVRIAQNCHIVAANHIFTDRNKLIIEQGMTRKGIKIGNDVWVGSGVNILDGVEIGDGAVIAAGSLVNKNVEPYTVVAGVPAKKVKDRS